MTYSDYQTVQPRIEYAGFFRRFAALILDGLLFSLVIAAFAFTFFDDYLPWTPLNFFDFKEFMNHEVLPFILTVMFWVYKAATPGKMAVDSKVVDAETGAKPTVVQSIIRYVGYYVSALPLGLGFIWAAIDEKNRTWHDLLAGTVVVKHA
ncbi:RDD family protein [Pseudoalteromonas spongiae]|uniref:RDD family protein n=1 Tax=Pseudoalteromonas spongiae TaxID=298657 RepID=UPI00026CAE8C|nr:RDD family protein [Pseudoalteromonas spongiae]ATD01393.1 hypothetical protein PSPO_b1560 [Pseudoalteromonas spongiae UST010723-006]